MLPPGAVCPRVEHEVSIFWPESIYGHLTSVLWAGRDGARPTSDLCLWRFGNRVGYLLFFVPDVGSFNSADYKREDGGKTPSGWGWIHGAGK
jgi:hypothetical protein